MSNPESSSPLLLSRLIEVRVNVALAALLPEADEASRYKAGEQLTRAIMEVDAGVPFRGRTYCSTHKWPGSEKKIDEQLKAFKDEVAALRTGALLLPVLRYAYPNVPLSRAPLTWFCASWFALNE